MPPHIEVEPHHDDVLQTPVPHPASNDEEVPSPLFRDDNNVKAPPPSSSLDRRQSDPLFAGKEVVLHEEPIKQAASPAAVSRITAIIGPESAYVKTTNAPASAAEAKAPAAAQQPTRPAAAAKPSPNQSGAKIEKKPLSLRASRFVKKHGWRAVPKKLASMASSNTARPAGAAKKVPVRHKNVV